MKVDRISNDMAAAELNGRYMTNHNKEKSRRNDFGDKIVGFRGTEIDEGLQQLHFFFSRQHVRRVNS